MVDLCYEPTATATTTKAAAALTTTTTTTTITTTTSTAIYFFNIGFIRNTRSLRWGGSYVECLPF